MPSFSSSPFQPWLRLILGGLGAASFGAGTVAVFTTANGTGAGVLLAFGGILLVLALLGDRIESIELGGSKLRLRAAAAEKYALAEELQHQGDVAAADRLRAEARALLEAAGPIASEYRAVRGSMRAGTERTMALERIVDRARRLATEQSFEPGEVIRWLRDGSDEERVTALAMMEAQPELRNFEAVLAAISDSRSPFEQYHAMRVAESMIADLDTRERRALAEVIKRARGLRFRHDTGRWQLSEQILDTLGAHSAGT